MEHENHGHNTPHVTHHKKKNITEKIRTNPWIVSTFVLGILAIVLIVGSVSGGISTKAISKDKAAELVLGFVESQVGEQAELVGVTTESGLYKVTVLFQGSQVPLYVTKDGENLVQGVLPLSMLEPQELEPTDSTQTSYTSDDLVKIKEFSQCLADNGVKAYGAEWCPYCNQFKEAFGGAEQITPFYYECQNADRTPTENAALCEQEQISGFPTIKINGEVYSGSRTIEGLANAIEACDIPELSNYGATQQAPTQTSYTGDDLVKVSTFVGCLADKGVKIYGANWCGWTKKFVVETIGGFDVVAPIYVECTENEAECSAAGISGYPTTKINGELYTGARDFEGLAQATGCQAPDVEALVQEDNTATGNC